MAASRRAPRGQSLNSSSLRSFSADLFVIVSVLLPLRDRSALGQTCHELYESELFDGLKVIKRAVFLGREEDVCPGWGISPFDVKFFDGKIYLLCSTGLRSGRFTANGVLFCKTPGSCFKDHSGQPIEVDSLVSEVGWDQGGMRFVNGMPAGAHCFRDRDEVGAIIVEILPIENIEDERFREKPFDIGCRGLVSQMAEGAYLEHHFIISNDEYEICAFGGLGNQRAVFVVKNQKDNLYYLHVMGIIEGQVSDNLLFQIKLDDRIPAQVSVNSNYTHAVVGYSQDGRIMVFDLQSGQTVCDFSIGAHHFGYHSKVPELQLSATGRKLLVASSSDQGNRILIYDVGGQSPRLLQVLEPGGFQSFCARFTDQGFGIISLVWLRQLPEKKDGFDLEYRVTIWE